MKNTGTLRIQTFAARQSAPVEGVTVAVQGDGFTLHCITDATGSAADIPVEAPACTLSLDEDNTTRPYAIVSLTAAKPGYRTVRIEGIQIFAGQVTLAQPQMLPDTEEGKDIPNAPIVIPPHALFAGSGGSGPQPRENCTPRVLDQVVIPKNITVHLGKPAASARNVTISFRDYIANVASSEVYPTWPEQALRANIHCQISLALNRIYTEWYPSKGYTFNITNSTSYDQYYVHGRTVFEVMVRITDDIFNTYLRKRGTVNPYYSEYCDGKSVTCPGLKQWGTVTLANNGRSALQILRYYYGSSIEIVRTKKHPLHPAELPRHAAAAGQPRRSGVHPAKAAEPHRQGLPLPWQTDGGRRIRQPDGCHSAGVPEAVQPDRRRRGGAADMVQDQLHLCIGKGPRGADQRGRNCHRHPVQRHMERHGAEHRRLWQCGGADAVLAEHTGTVRPASHPCR